MKNPNEAFPAFMSFNSTNLTLSIDKTSAKGVYNLVLMGWLPTLVKSSIDIQVIIESNEGPPFFTSELQGLIITAGTS
jgi:hypothetical protein